MTPKPDSRLPWRVVQSHDGLCQVWEPNSDSTQCRSIAECIPSLELAELLAKAPELARQVGSLTRNQNAALAILDRLQGCVIGTMDGNVISPVLAIREVVSILKNA